MASIIGEAGGDAICGGVTSGYRPEKPLGGGRQYCTGTWKSPKRLHGTWPIASESPGPVAERFAGPVEVDETHIGGKESNKHESKKLRAGRGTVGKTPVVGMKDRETNQIEAEVVTRMDRPTLRDLSTNTPNRMLRSIPTNGPPIMG